jgi:hypothetical protein
MIETTPMQSLSTFYVPWLAAAAASIEQPAPTGAMIVLNLGDGFQLPLVHSVLAIAGVLMAFPLAPKQNPPLGKLKSALVALIMIVLALVWVSQSRPNFLFTFVVAIGLGFSGFSLIELAGQELMGLVKQLFSALRERIASITGTSK